MLYGARREGKRLLWRVKWIGVRSPGILSCALLFDGDNRSIFALVFAFAALCPAHNLRFLRF